MIVLQNTHIMDVIRITNEKSKWLSRYTFDYFETTISDKYRDTVPLRVGINLLGKTLQFIKLLKS